MYSLGLIDLGLRGFGVWGQRSSDLGLVERSWWEAAAGKKNQQRRGFVGWHRVWRLGIKFKIVVPKN